MSLGSCSEVRLGTRHFVAFKYQGVVLRGSDLQDSGVCLMSFGWTDTCFPRERALCILTNLLHCILTSAAVHGDIVLDALVEVVEEKRAKGSLLFQARCIVSLKVSSPQMPKLFTWGLVFPLHDSEGAEGGGGLVHVWRVFLLQGSTER